MTSIEEQGAANGARMKELCEAGYRRLESALESLQNGHRGRVISSSVVLATWEDRPVWLSYSELLEISMLFQQKEAATNLTLLMLTAVYRNERYDQRLTPALAINSEGQSVAVLVKKP